MTTGRDDAAAPGDDVAVDLAVLAALLRADGLDVEPPLSASRIGQGQSNLTYIVRDAADRCWVVRRPPRGELLASAHDVLREHRIMSALTRTDVPVPQIHAKYVDDRLADAPVIVMEYVDGLVIDRMSVAGTVPDRLRARVGESLAVAMAQVHAVDVDAVGLGDLSSRSPYAARQLKRWSRQWEQSRTRALPRLGELTSLLARCAPEQTETRLVHGDLSIRNVILDPEEATVRAVLDWELSTLGDPMADAGSLLAYWPQPGDPPTMVFAASSLPSFCSREQLAVAYLDASGRSQRHLAYWHAFGLWKLAVIGEGVLRRSLEDPRNAADDGPPTAESIEHLVEQAWQVVQAGRVDS